MHVWGVVKVKWNGLLTYFQDDFWVRDVSFRVRSSRLFRTSVHQSLSIGTMSFWVNGVWEWDFRWRHRLFVWKQLLVVELLVVADGRQLSKGVDSWSWNLPSDGVYSVQYAYGSLSNDTLGECGRVSELSHLLVWVWRS